MTGDVQPSLVAVGRSVVSKRANLRMLGVIVGLAIVYFGAAKLGLTMAVLAEQVSVVWPATGIALVAVLRFGFRVWPGIWLGAFLANATANEPIATACGIATGNTLEAILGAWLLWRFSAFDNSLERLKDILGLIVLAAGVSTTTSATIGVASLCLGGVHPWSNFGELWSIWWFGDAMGNLVVAPILLTATFRRASWSFPRFMEAGALALGLVAVGWVVFNGRTLSDAPYNSLVYAVFPFVTWAALRFGPFGTALVTFTASAFAIWGALYGVGAFGSGPIHDRLMSLQAFMAVVAVTGLLLAAALVERRRDVQRKDVMHAVARILAESSTLSEATPRIIQSVCQSLAWQVGAIWQVDRDSAVLRCAGVWHIGSASFPKFETLTRERTFESGVGLPGRVWRSGRPDWIPDVVRDSNFPRAQVADQEGLHAAFGFPIRLGEEIYGVIEFFSPQIRQPDQDLLRVMGTIGIQVGQFIERRLGDDAIRRSEARKAAILNSAMDAIITIDHEGQIVEFNPSAERMFGWAQHQAVGKPIVDLIIPPSLKEKHRQGLARYLATGEIVALNSRLELTAQKSDGTEFPVELTVTRIPFSGPPMYSGYIRDITERKRLERELQVVTDTMSAPVSRCSRDLRYRWVSKSYADWIGRPADEIVGRPILEIVGAEAFGQLRPYFEQVLAGEEVRYENQVEFPGLGQRWITAVYTPTFDMAGVVDGWVAIVLDIEERRRAEDRVRESEEKYRRIVETANEGIWALDAEAHITFVNCRMAEMLGYKPQEMLGRTKWHFVLDEEQDRVRELFAGRQRGVSEQADVGFRHRDGRPVWTIMAARPVMDKAGAFQGSLDMFTDVTERRKVDETVRSLLRISERLNSTLDVEALLDILVQEAVTLVRAESGVSGLRTAEGMVCRRYFQKGCVLPLEYCWPPMHGLPGWLLVHKVPYLTNDALHDGQIVHELCVQFGVRSALSTPIITAQGEIVGFFEIHNKQDSSGFTWSDQEMLLAVSQTAAIAVQNALAYRRIREAQESFQESDRRKDEFLATLAHELRNPLAPLRNGLELLRLAGDDRSMADQARTMMERQLHQMVRLIDDLLDVSRISSGKLQLQKSRVELADVVRSALETCQPAIEAAGHEFELSLPKEPVYLDADPTRLAQAIGNLLGNACKYTERGGRIQLSAEHHDSDLLVSIRDNGLGIPPPMLDGIFEMFTQVDPSLEKSHGGLGIGLTIVKRLIELHGGGIEARSEGMGKGSEFVVRLPVAASMVQEAKVNGAGAFVGGTIRRRILVADDNQDSARSLAMMLKLIGNEVRAAHDGQEAVDLAASFQPDVVLLDIGMPKLNGYDAARNIRQQPWGRRMVLIALSGWGQEEDKRRSQEAGFDHHLVKPVELVVLEEVLRSTPAA